MPLRILDPGDPFSMDMRAPNSDPIAYKAAVYEFGPRIVNSITKEYRRSRLTKEGLLADVMEYDRKYAPRLEDDDVYKAVLESVRKDFTPPDPIIPTTLGAVYKTGLQKSKSPGLPWKERGYASKGEVAEDPAALAEIHERWRRVGKGLRCSYYDSMCYARCQVVRKDKPDKNRMTWGYPMEMVVEEGRYLYPYLKWIRHTYKDVPVAYGMETACGGMGAIDKMWQNISAKHPDVKALMWDWKTFDKTIPPWLIRDAFRIIYQCFDPSRVKDSEGKIWPVDPEKTLRRWRRVVNYFINTPFRLSTGERFQKEGGVPSGSGFTNLLDTIVNTIVVRYCVYHTTGSFPKWDMYMGDDAIVMATGHVNIEDIAAVALSSFGMIGNVNKSYLTTQRLNIQFLGYYNDHGTPFRDVDGMVAAFIFPERYVEQRDPQFTALRALGQLWSTCNAIQATHWYYLIKRIEEEYSLPPDWMEEAYSQSPGLMKFLKLHGYDPDALVHLPALNLYRVAAVAPPPAPLNRQVIERRTDCLECYQNYFLNWTSEEEWTSRFPDLRKIHG